MMEGKELRLKQEYFLCSATLQDIVRRYKKHKSQMGGDARSTFKEFHNKARSSILHYNTCILIMLKRLKTSIISLKD